MTPLEELPDAPEVGVETEDDAADLSLAEVHSAYVTGSDWTTETILLQLRKGNINLNPQFQRREVWKANRKSRLIESIILNLPIPQIVLAELKERKNNYIVLDGKQRLLTIRQFCANPDEPQDEGFDPLSLTGLGVLTDLSGKTYEMLCNQAGFVDIRDAFDNHTIRTVVIRNWPNDDFLFRVFRRLNTGSVQLSPQELRQALKPGPFTDFLDEFTSTSKPVLTIFGHGKPDFRMRDNEIFLRYMAFATNVEQYRGNLKQFLDDATETLNSRWLEHEAEIRMIADQCNEAIQATRVIFEEDAFATYNQEQNSFVRRFNRAVFDIMTYYFREPHIRKAAIRHGAQVKGAFVDLSQQRIDFQQSLTTTTKSKKATAVRFARWAKALTEVIGVPVAAPESFAEIVASDR